MLALLTKIKGYLIAAGVFVGVLVAAYLKGQSDARHRAKEQALKTKLRIHEAITKTDKRNEVEHEKATENASKGDWAGFNRTPDGMRRKR